MKFTEKLISASRANNSLVCVGLDSDLKKLPDCLKNLDDPVSEFNSGIISSTSSHVCAYKLNLAFYEALGKRGWDILEKTLAQIPENIITIADAKRGDIGNTSDLYARAFFETFNFDAITVNPFLGYDSVQPFLEYKDKGIFILTLTSNPGSRDYQYLEIEGKPLYMKTVEKILKWNVNENCGLVVGATHPDELSEIRFKADKLPLLIPGIGAQGGDLEATIKSGCNRHGELALINLSRAVIYASNKEDYAEKAGLAALDYKNKINNIREPFFKL
jgi:orotidine-5'-phosphate decarboxylase